MTPPLWLALRTIRRQHALIRNLEGLVDKWYRMYEDQRVDNVAIALQLDEARDELDDLRRLSGWLSQ